MTRADIIEKAADVFGTREEAMEWLHRPAMALDQQRPIDLLDTPEGLQLVSDLLIRLENGTYT